MLSHVALRLTVTIQNDRVANCSGGILQTDPTGVSSAGPSASREEPPPPPPGRPAGRRGSCPTSQPGAEEPGAVWRENSREEILRQGGHEASQRRLKNHTGSNGRAETGSVSAETGTWPSGPRRVSEARRGPGPCDVRTAWGAAEARRSPRWRDLPSARCSDPACLARHWRISSVCF